MHLWQKSETLRRGNAPVWKVCGSVSAIHSKPFAGMGPKPGRVRERKAPASMGAGKTRRTIRKGGCIIYEQEQRHHQPAGDPGGLRRGAGAPRAGPGYYGQGVHHLPWPLRVRQDHHPAHHRRLHRAAGGGHLLPGAAHQRGAALQAPGEYRLPAVRPFPAPERLREH